MLKLPVSNSHFLLFRSSKVSRKTARLPPLHLLKVTKKNLKKNEGKNRLVVKCYKRYHLLYFVWKNIRYCPLKLLSNSPSPSLCSIIVHVQSDSSLKLSTTAVLARHTNSLSCHDTCGELSSPSPRIYHQEQVFSGFLALEISWLWGCCLSLL